MKKKTRGKLAEIIKVRINERIINTVIGGMASGKTFETKKVIERYIKKFPKEKVLILDSSDEYTEYKEVAIDKIGTIKKPSRIKVSNDNMSDVAKAVMYNFKHGLLVIEGYSDFAFNYFDLSSLTACNRTKDIDVIVIKKDIRSMPINVIENTSVFRVHKSSIDFSLLRAIDKTHISPTITVAFHAMLNNKSRFSFCYFDALGDVVVGAKKADVIHGCFEFLRPTVEAFARSIVKYKPVGKIVQVSDIPVKKIIKKRK